MAATASISSRVFSSIRTNIDGKNDESNSSISKKSIFPGFSFNNSRECVRSNNLERAQNLIAFAKTGFRSELFNSDSYVPREESVPDNLGLNVDVIPEEKSRSRLVVTVPASICGYFWRTAVKKVQEELKAGNKNNASALSESALISSYGVDKLKRACLEILMRETAKDAFTPVENDMISNKYSQHFAKSGDEMIAEFDKSKPYKYEVFVDMVPKVQWKEERCYFKTPITLKMDDADPSEEAEKELKALIREKGSLRVKQGTGFEMGDVGIMSLETVRINGDGSDGEKILSCCQEGFTVDSESSLFMPGLVSGMIGMDREESRTYDLDFPMDWPVQSLRGVKGRFQVTCNEVFVREFPSLENSEIIQEIVPGASNLDEAKAILIEKHSKLFKEGMDHAVTMAVLNKLPELCEMEVPYSLVLEDAEQLFMLHLGQIQAKHSPTPEQLREMSSEDQFKLFLKVQGEHCEMRVRQSIAMDDIYEKEPHLHVTEEELQQELTEALKQFEGSEDEISTEKLKEQAYTLLRERKVLAWLSENADISFTV